MPVLLIVILAFAFETAGLILLVRSVRLDQTNTLCLECRYDLRGLAGEVITCPECGAKMSRKSLRHRVVVSRPFLIAGILVMLAPFVVTFVCLFILVPWIM
jgi:hypothetical protein